MHKCINMCVCSRVHMHYAHAWLSLYDVFASELSPVTCLLVQRYCKVCRRYFLLPESLHAPYHTDYHLIKTPICSSLLVGPTAIHFCYSQLLPRSPPFLLPYPDQTAWHPQANPPIYPYTLKG